MIHKTIKKISTTLLIAYVFMADAVFGQIVPIEPGGVVTCAGPNCTWNQFIGMVNLILNKLIQLALIFSAIIFAYAGYLLITSGDNAGNRKKAIEMMQMVFIGLAFVLLAWVLVTELLNSVGLNGGIRSLIFN